MPRPPQHLAVDTSPEFGVSSRSRTQPATHDAVHRRRSSVLGPPHAPGADDQNGRSRLSGEACHLLQSGGDGSGAMRQSRPARRDGLVNNHQLGAQAARRSAEGCESSGIRRFRINAGDVHDAAHVGAEAVKVCPHRAGRLARGQDDGRRGVESSCSVRHLAARRDARGQIQRDPAHDAGFAVQQGNASEGFQTSAQPSPPVSLRAPRSKQYVSPVGSASAGVGSPSSRHRSRKCSCDAERSFSAEARHFVMKA